MRNLFRAEWIKIAGNRWVAGCLIWIFPLGAVAFLVLAGLVLALSSSARAGLRQDDAILWTEQAISMWNFPNNPVGRLILLGFTAVVFAGEYQWQTWKNVVPRNRRAALILIKFLALGVFVVLAFSLMSALWTAGWAVLARIAPMAQAGLPAKSAPKAFDSEALPKAPSLTGIPRTSPGYRELEYLAKRRMVWSGSVLLKPGTQPVTGAQLSTALAQMIAGLNGFMTDEPEALELVRPMR